MKDIIISLALVVALVVVAVFAITWFDPTARDARAADAARTEATEQALQPVKQDIAELWQYVLNGSLMVIAVAGALLAIGFSASSVRRWWLHSLLTFAEKGMYAAIFDGKEMTPPSVHAERTATAQAIFNGNADRFPGAGARHVFNPTDEIAGELPAPPVEYDPAALIHPDPTENPDTLVVGRKGSGKTNVLRYILWRYIKDMPDAEFMIMSTVASNWGHLDAISEPDQIFEAMRAVSDEMRARDMAMKQAGVLNYHQWNDAPPKTVVLIDEGEDVADKIALHDRRTSQEFGRIMRSNINTGRNFGFMFIVGTQTARTDVMDSSFLHNAAHVLLMRMDADTAARFKLWDSKTPGDPKIVSALSNAETGRAYVPHGSGGWVSFPWVENLPRPRMSSIYRPRLALPVDAEADGLGVDDQPSDVIDAVYQTTIDPQLEALKRGEKIKPPDGELPMWSAWMVQYVYDRWIAQRRNLAAVQEEMYAYSGGRAYYVTANCVNEALRRRGRAPAYSPKGR